MEFPFIQVLTFGEFTLSNEKTPANWPGSLTLEPILRWQRSRRLQPLRRLTLGL